MKHFNLVIWDVDGVILDSPKINFNFFCEKCEQFGKEQPYKTIEEWKENIHPDWKVNYSMVGFSREEITKLENNDRKDRIITQKHPLNEGVEGLILDLKHRGITQGILTSNHSELVINNIGDLSQLMGFIIDYEDVGKTKPHPEGLLKALEITNTNPNEAVYLGDMVTDILAAYNAKMSCIIHTKGVHPKSKLKQAAKKYGNCKLVDSIQEIGDYLL